MQNELAYAQHWALDNKVRKLYHTLRDLYGSKISREKLFTKAFCDHVIDIQERRLLQEFIISDNM